jgi:hypothetical protein
MFTAIYYLRELDIPCRIGALGSKEECTETAGKFAALTGLETFPSLTELIDSDWSDIAVTVVEYSGQPQNVSCVSEDGKSVLVYDGEMIARLRSDSVSQMLPDQTVYLLPRVSCQTFNVEESVDLVDMALTKFDKNIWIVEDNEFYTTDEDD